MILLKDIRDYISSLGIAEDEHCYCGILPDKEEKSIGTYNLKAGRQPVVPVGGTENSSYTTKAVSFLVHWNHSPGETEETAIRLYEELQETKSREVNSNLSGMRITDSKFQYQNAIPLPRTKVIILLTKL